MIQIPCLSIALLIGWVLAQHTPSEQINLVGSSGASKIRFDGDSSNLQNNFIGITGYDDLIIASDEANSGSASTIQFKVDGTERMRIDSGGDVGIATTSITGAFHVDKAVQGSPIATFHNTSGNTSGDAGIEVETSTTATYIQRWVNAGSEKARILANGGLTFNGDTAAANALDDYETGTCTLTSPSSVANSTGVAHAYANFTKIGNLVTIQGAFDSVNHNSGRIAFTAHVPFAMATASNTGQLGVLAYTLIQQMNLRVIFLITQVATTLRFTLKCKLMLVILLVLFLITYHIEPHN